PVTDVSIAFFHELAAGWPIPAPAGRKPTKLLMLRTFSSFFLGPFAGAGGKDAGRANGDGKLPGPPSPCLRGRSCHIFAFLSLGRYIRVPNNMGARMPMSGSAGTRLYAKIPCVHPAVGLAQEE